MFSQLPRRTREDPLQIRHSLSQFRLRVALALVHASSEQLIQRFLQTFIRFRFETAAGKGINKSMSGNRTPTNLIRDVSR